MEIIKLEKINKIYRIGENEQQVLNDVSLTVNKGELIAIMGSSGSGKSTLLNLLGLLDGKYNGKYILDNMEISELTNKEIARMRNKKLGFVFQNFNLIKELSARENVKMSLIFSNIYIKKKMSRKEMDTKACKVLEKVGLKEHINKKPGQLSGGQQQRVAIARALVNDPDIILADEPTGALDSKTGSEIMKLFLQLKNFGKTVIIVTHDKKIADLCQRVIYINDGVIKE